MHFLYTIAIYLLSAGMQVWGLWDKKIQLGNQGRRHWRQRYPALLPPQGKKRLWMHVASLGEFEQGRPVLEAFRQAYPDWAIVLTFFSPSGYEMRKHCPQADTVLYLPLDTPANARDFTDLLQPDIIIFVKYEFWANYLFAARHRNIPTVLIAALFRPEQPFFQWYGAFWRKILSCFTHIFTQTTASERLLHQIGYTHTTVAGDTRIDRVLQIAQQAADNTVVARFAANNTVLVVGSSWGKDEDLLLQALQHPDLRHLKVICAPHTPTAAHVTRLMSCLGNTALRYSEATNDQVSGARWLIIDNIGLLNTLYKYGDIAYIGGGFGAGIHNTLEPAAFELPVVFGPRYHKFEEAQQLVQRGGGFAVTDAAQLETVLRQLIVPEKTLAASHQIRQYLQETKGGTAQVMAYWTAMQI